MVKTIDWHKKDADEIYPENEFCIAIYLNELEICYNRIKKGESVNVKQLKQKMEVYGFDDDLKIFQDIVDKLSSPIEKYETRPESFKNTRDLLLLIDNFTNHR